MSNHESSKRLGRRVGWRKPPLGSRPPSEDQTFSIERWCIDADVARTLLYDWWASGKGPTRVRLGGRVFITESPREFFARVAQEQTEPPASGRKQSASTAAEAV